MYNLFEEYDDYLDEDTAIQLAADIITKLSNAHPEWRPDYRLLTISLEGYDSTNCLGRTGFHRSSDGRIEIEITVSRYILKNRLVELFKNTFAHEYCHYLAMVDMINDPGVDLYGKKTSFATPELEEFYEADDGHGECWLAYAAEVSKILDLQFPITPHPREPESALYASQNMDEIVVSIVCPNGDFKDDLYEKSPSSLFEYDSDRAAVMAAIIKGDMPCPMGCGHKLYLDWAKPELEAAYIKELKAILYRIAMVQLLKELGL